MIVTLYKNCILSNSYSEVFDVKVRQGQSQSVLDTYLSRLTSYTGELDFTYTTNSGTIVLPLAVPNVYAFVYEYNYMKVQSDDSKFKRYCFIDDIVVGNDVATIYYSEDYWHSYAGTMHLRNSYLTRAKQLHYDNLNIFYYNLPIEYTTNDKIISTSLSNETDVMFVCQFQTYETAQSGESNNISNSYAIVTKPSTQSRYDNMYLSFQEAVERIEYMVKTQATKHFQPRDTTDPDDALWYRLDNIYLIPKSFGILEDLQQSGASVIKLGWLPVLASDFSPTLIEIPSIAGIRTSLSNEIQADSTMIGIGTYTSFYAVPFNGSNIKYKIEYNTTVYNFNVFLNINGALIDITEDFNVDLPYNTLTGDVQAQRKLARELQNVNGALSIVGGVVNAGVSVTDIGLANEKADLYTGLSKRARRRATKERYYLSATNAQRSAVSSTVDTLGNVSSIVQGVSTLINANSPNYLSTTGTFARPIGILNAIKGIVKKSITPDNSSLVSKIVSESGYIVYEIVDDRIFDLDYTEIYHNILKFDFVNVYGNMPQDALNVVKNILLNGFKIWYTADV